MTTLDSLYGQAGSFKLALGVSLLVFFVAAGNSGVDVFDIHGRNLPMFKIL